MAPGSIIAAVAVVLAVVLAVALGLTRRRRASSSAVGPGPAVPTGRRLTSDALGRLEAPTWRVVHEVADDALGGIDHVLIGPIGVVAVVTRLTPLAADPAVGNLPNGARDLAASAVARAELDDALAAVGMRSDVLVDLHWGRNDVGAAFVEVGHDHLAIDGRRLGEWLDVAEPRLTPTLVDLAWSTIVTAVGRPDPLRPSDVSRDRTR